MDKKVAGLAMKFAAFVLDDVKKVGKEAALRQTLAFNEEQELKENMHFLFENMPLIKVTKVAMNTDETAVEGPTATMVREGAMPGKPAILFY